MPGAQIVANQATGAGAGTPGVARNDLWKSQAVQLVDSMGGNSSWQWTLLDKPATSAASLTGATTANAAFTPDVIGSYRVRLITNGGGPGNIVIMVLRVRYSNAGVLENRGWAYPAMGELQGESNYGSNERAWAQVIEAIAEDIRVTLTTLEGSVSGDVTLEGDVEGDADATIVRRIQGVPVYDNTQLPAPNRFILMSNGTIWDHQRFDPVLTPVKTANYTAAVDEIVRCNTAGGGFTVTLPTAVGNASRFITVLNVGNAGGILVDTTGGQTINGNATTAIAEGHGVVTVMSDGANWQIVDRILTQAVPGASDSDPTSVDVSVNAGVSDDFSRADHVHDISLAAIVAIRTVSVSAIKTGAYSAVIDELVRCNPTGGGFTVTLPTAVGNSGRKVAVVNVNSSPNTITIATTGGQTINGAGSASISESRGAVVLMSDGANWFKLAIVNNAVPSTSNPASVGTALSAGTSTDYARADHVHDIGAAAVAAVRAVPVTAIKTSGYTAAIDELVRCNTTSGGFAVTLPTAVGNDGRGITIKKVVSHANAVTINTTSSQTIDGAASGSITITDVLGTITVISDGANWMRFPPA